MMRLRSPTGMQDVFWNVSKTQATVFIMAIEAVFCTHWDYPPIEITELKHWMFLLTFLYLASCSGKQNYS